MKRIEKNSYLFEDRPDDLGGFEKTKTQQSFAEEVDVNNIVARALKTGLLGDPMAQAARQAVFGDFSEVGSYHDAMNKVVAAQNAFMELPADLRARFNNDPGLLCEFMANEANLEEAVKLGLVPDAVLLEKAKAEKAAADAAKAAAEATQAPAPEPGIK